MQVELHRPTTSVLNQNYVTKLDYNQTLYDLKTHLLITVAKQC